MSEIVLDASALLAFIFNERGADVVAEVVLQAAISAVNLSEVITKLLDNNMPIDEIVERISSLGLTVVPFDSDQAFQAALLRSSTKHLGLSLGDRVCLQLARSLGRPVLTTDRAWAQLPGLLVEVKLIR